MAITNRSQLANSTATQQGLYNQALTRQQQLKNQQQYLQMAQVSPMFALGNLIGNMIYDKYNSRGVNKEKQAISDALAAYKGDNNYNAMNDILTAQQTQTGTPVISAGSGDNLGTTEVPPQGPNTIMPVPAQVDMNSFDLDKFKSKYFEEARQRGRTDDQINEAWNTMQPQINELAGKAKEARINAALGAMTPDENGKYSFGEMSLSNPNFISFMRPLIKDDPTMAAYIMKSAQTQDANRAATAKMNQNNAFRLALADKNAANKLSIAQYKGENKVQKSQAPKETKISAEKMKYVDKELARLDAIEAGDELNGIKPRALTDTEKRQKAMLEQTKEDYLYGAPQSLDINDAADVEDTLMQASAAVKNGQMSYTDAMKNLAMMGALKSPHFMALAKKYGFDYAGGGYNLAGDINSPEQDYLAY